MNHDYFQTHTVIGRKSGDGPFRIPTFPCISENYNMSVRRHRTSSVGRIQLGDNAVPSLSTMNSQQEQARKSKKTFSFLADPSGGTGDSVLLAKIFIGLRELCARHAWLLPLAIMAVVHGSYLTSGNRTESNWLHPFVDVSYEFVDSDGEIMYGKGGRDFLFVFYYMIFFTFFREFLMEMVLRPIAKKLGVKRESKICRFVEQTYSMVYYGMSGPFGIYIMKQLPLWYFETLPFYENYPHKAHTYLFKVYYLGQAAFWAQQSVVLMLQLEKPRKDFKELVLHHIITIALIWTSYRFHFTWMGLAVYITMDVSDFFLAFSKTLNYLNSPFVVPFFIIFIAAWIYLRHYLNIIILWSVLTEFSKVGPYELNFSTGQYKCWISQPIVFTLIAALQLVNLYWLFLILRILYRVVFQNIVKDERSDSESDEEEETKKQQ